MENTTKIGLCRDMKCAGPSEPDAAARNPINLSLSYVEQVRTHTT